VIIDKSAVFGSEALDHGEFEILKAVLGFSNFRSAFQMAFTPIPSSASIACTAEAHSPNGRQGAADRFWWRRWWPSLKVLKRTLQSIESQGACLQVRAGFREMA
jgi:hypothetical protein